MNKIFLIISFALLTVFFATPVEAQRKYGLPEAAGKANYDVSGGTSIYSIVEIAVKTFLALIGFIFFYLMSVSGLRWLTARGNDEFVASAKNTMSAAIWGLIITMGAYGLTTFIFSALNQ